MKNKRLMMLKLLHLLKLRNEEKRKFSQLNRFFRIEHDANLLANRIALLKQEEMKTWKKIEDTRKRTNEIVSLKNRNEERI
jgi:hypothetical protein